MKSKWEELVDILNEEREYCSIRDGYEEYYVDLGRLDDWRDKWIEKRLREIGVERIKVVQDRINETWMGTTKINDEEWARQVVGEEKTITEPIVLNLSDEIAKEVGEQIREALEREENRLLKEIARTLPETLGVKKVEGIR